LKKIKIQLKQKAEEQDSLGGNSFLERRERLSAFFSKRLRDGGWTFQNSLPRNGRDPTFDSLVDQLGLKKNRQYAPTQWRKFKQDKGVFPPSSFEIPH
jgi:hypothetical protein